MTALLRPASHTALAALPVLVVDLETTGLDVTRDRIVQIGAIPMIGARFDESEAIDRLVDPGGPIPPASTRIHGIDDSRVAGAPMIADCLPQLRRQLSGSVAVGHNVGFDLAVLRHEAFRVGCEWTDPVSIDLVPVVGAIEPGLPDLSLETVADLFGIVIRGRHSAMGDCLAAAEIFAALVARLRDLDVRTLGELQTFARRREDLLLRQARAGWLARPGAQAAAVTQPYARIDSHVFAHRVRDVMSAPATTIEAGATLRRAARLMVDRRIGALVVVEGSGGPALGILTERDLLRALVDVDADTVRVAERMSRPVQTISADDRLYRALGRMDRLGIRHLCVVDGGDSIVGMISQRDLLSYRGRSATVLGDELETACDATQLAAAYGRLPEVAAGLVAEGVDGREVARVVSSELRAVTARCAALTVEALENEGRGPTPGSWCVLVLGSGGRGESLLVADQDNAMIHGPEADGDGRFEAFGQGIASLLDVSGIPRCKGGVMASNAQWRGDLNAWSSRVEGWLRRARPRDLLNVDIFFDLTPVAGDADLARDLHARAVAAASQSPTFLALLAESVGSLAPTFGWFGRLRTDDGRIDLKRSGLLPLVSMARALALRVGSTARPTPERIRDAAASGRLSEVDADILVDIHGELLTWILRQQLADLDAGIRPSSRVDLARLDHDETSHLRRRLQQLDGILSTLRGSMAR